MPTSAGRDVAWMRCSRVGEEFEHVCVCVCSQLCSGSAKLAQAHAAGSRAPTFGQHRGRLQHWFTLAMRGANLLSCRWWRMPVESRVGTMVRRLRKSPPFSVPREAIVQTLCDFRRGAASAPKGRRKSFHVSLLYMCGPVGLAELSWHATRTASASAWIVWL